ncbi:MAG: TrmH family RNA methyltransferase [Bacilli bacterium]
MIPKKYSKQSNLSYTLGATLTIELLENKPHVVKHVYVHSETTRNDTFLLIERLCAINHISLSQNNKAFNILSEKENVFYIGEFEKYQSPLKENTNHLVLVNPANMGNLGTIIRTMVGFNLNQLVIITPAVDLFDPKVIRASMGSFFHLHFSLFPSFDDYQKAYKNHPYCFMLNGKHHLGEISFQSPYAMVFGNEATGLDASFLATFDSVRINHSDTIDSLNLPMAVGIALYEQTKSHFQK